MNDDKTNVKTEDVIINNKTYGKSPIIPILSVLEELQELLDDNEVYRP